MAQSSNVIGSLVFCPHCGSLLQFELENQLLYCDVCNYSQNSSDFQDLVVHTRSSPKTFNSILKEKRSKINQFQNQEDEGATIKEKCPSCGHDEMNFHTMQLRSADEGQTIFYHCRKCGYKYSLNS
ncbi:hypothetical protein G9A89_023740 [Geosiphon pyriformis]|nr:hypothetical protein G9A89_023740 [Geosiphon pyriformis]